MENQIFRIIVSSIPILDLSKQIDSIVCPFQPAISRKYISEISPAIAIAYRRKRVSTCTISFWSLGPDEISEFKLFPL